MVAEIRHRTRSSGAVVAQQPVPVMRERARFLNNTKGQQGLPFGAAQEAADKDDGGLHSAIKSFNSQQVSDPFAESYRGIAGASISIISPPMNLSALMKMPNENNALRQCIDAMVTNIEGFGYRLEYKGPEGQEDSAEAQEEKRRCTSLLEQPNGEYPLLDLRERFRRDLETVGDGYMEVTRNNAGDVSMLYHLPAATMRLTGQDKDPVEVAMSLNRNGVDQEVKVRRFFRRYVQMVGAKRVYFKEFGDPRTIDPSTGEVNDTLSFEESATEVMRLSLYTPGQVYGMPRWINQLKAIVGSNEADTTNMNFFRDNAIPACAVLVSGGSLTGDAVDAIQNLITGRMGRDAANRVIVIEATGDAQAASPEGNIPAPRVEIKSLQAERQSDALFQEYDKNNQKKIRGAFRLPPLFVGFSDDLTYASAQTAMILAEGQMFGPERKKVDELFNTHLLTVGGKPLKHWVFRSNPPRIVGGDALFEALEKLEKMGAMTPNIAIGLANEMFDTNIRTIEEDWGDFPYQMTQELVKQGRLMGVLGVIDNGNPVRAQLVKGVQKDGIVPDDPAGPIKDVVASGNAPGVINDANPQPEKDPATGKAPAKKRDRRRTQEDRMQVAA